MKFLVTGAKGQLGYDVVNEIKSHNFDVLAVDVDEMDITDCDSVTKTISEYNPNIVIHCAAFTNVDGAETPENIELAKNINAQGTRYIANVCKDLDCKMVYISTDYVFADNGNEPILEDCTDFNPLNVYAKTKLDGEMAVKDCVKKHFIVRTSWVFGKNGNNFVKTMINLSKTRDCVKVVSDQIGNPTYTKDLAKFLFDLSLGDNYGVYHATNEGEYISWYDFAVEIFKQIKSDIKVIPVTTEEYGAKAQRPKNSRLSKEKLHGVYQKGLPHWKDALERYLNEIAPSKIKVEKNVGDIEGLCVITPTVHGDNRGYFMECYNKMDLLKEGIDIDFVQDNQSSSSYGVLRGLHRQINYPQAKLVRVLQGKVFDVAVDLRQGSKTYGKWYGIELSEENQKQFLIPRGFAHGFLVLSEKAVFSYKVDDYFHPNDEAGIIWNDEHISVQWPIPDGMEIKLSEKDKNWQSFK